MKRFYLIALYFSLCLPSIVRAMQIEEVRMLAEGNASQLALRNIDRIQTELFADKPQWMEWEKLRIGIYNQTRDWDALSKRVDELPVNLPGDFMLWMQTEQVRAYLASRQAGKALQVLRKLTWNLPANQQVAETWLPQWRRLVMDSYLQLQAFEDAQVASHRYYQDYPQQGVEDLLLQARINLANNRPEEVLSLLQSKRDDFRIATLYLLAQLRSQQLTPAAAIKTALSQLKENQPEGTLRLLLWSIIAEAANHNGDRATASNALEHVLAEPSAGEYEDLFSFNAGSLWNSYIDYATWFGNRQQFLIGKDRQWFDAARKAEKKTPVLARSLYALLMLRGQDNHYRSNAIAQFIALAKKREQGDTLLTNIFLKSGRFIGKKNTPPDIQHALVDIALAQSDIRLASELMAGIKEPPPGADNFFWHLRRARIFVLGGDEAKAVTALQTLLAGYALIPDVQVDRVLQVVFDLQTVGAHKNAIELFNVIQAKTVNPSVKREIFFWIADSHYAEENYVEAASFYLKSAMFIEELKLDPWAQTARYKAAESLAQAGLLTDARAIFQHLLKVTKEPARRAVLQHELQKLLLMKDEETSAVFRY